MKKNYILYALIFVAVVVFIIWNRTEFNPVTPGTEIDMPADEFKNNPELVPFEANTQGVTPVIDKSNIKEYLKTYKSPENIRWQVETKMTGTSGVSRQTINYYKKGSREFIEVIESGKTIYTYSYSGGSVKVNNKITGESITVSSGEQYSKAAVMRMPEIEFFLEASTKQITDARFDLLDNRQVIFIEYTFPELNQTERYWISLEYGVVLKSESLASGNVVMSSETKIIDNNVPDKIF